MAMVGWRPLLIVLQASAALSGGAQPVGKVSTEATCILRVLDPPLDTHAVYFRDLYDWVAVKFQGQEGWVKRRFLTEQPKEECLPRP